ncbi:hypothetical protein [Phenylobacterium sp.]|uniref:hypothetical protein n=1 Tax=Phenylobacterium sp. TaxID=1871053 RepID=UPI00374D3EAC
MERAQAEGKLARVKLDVRDQFEATIEHETDGDRAKSLATFTEEIEAFCTDLRLAVVTVQAQVERGKRRWGRGILTGLLFAFSTFVAGFALFMATQGTPAAVLAFGGPPFAFWIGVAMGSKPEEFSSASTTAR